MQGREMISQYSAPFTVPAIYDIKLTRAKR